MKLGYEFTVLNCLTLKATVYYDDVNAFVVSLRTWNKHDCDYILSHSSEADKMHKSVFNRVWFPSTWPDYSQLTHTLAILVTFYFILKRDTLILPANVHCYEQEEHENETSINILISYPGTGELSCDPCFSKYSIPSMRVLYEYCQQNCPCFERISVPWILKESHYT